MNPMAGPIPRDGNCLFSTIASTVLGDVGLGMEVRKLVVEEVVKQWEKYHYLTMKGDGSVYSNQQEYQADMSRRGCYGTEAEIQAASVVFKTRFEIYRNGQLYAVHGQADHPVAQIKFTGNIMGGHFEPLYRTDMTQLSEPDVEKLKDIFLQLEGNSKRLSEADKKFLKGLENIATPKKHWFVE